MRRHWLVRVFAVLGVLVGATVVGPHVATAVTNSPLDCDGVVAVAGGYRLTHDSTCGPFTMTGDDEFFDLGGHTLTGQFRAQGDREELRNGTLIQTGLSTAEFTDGFKISHMTFRAAPVSPPNTSFWLEAGANFTVRDSTFADVPGIAIDFYFNNGGSIRNSTFKGNRYGISIQKSSDVVIEHNRFVDNERGVNLWDEDGLGVDRNTMRSNVFRGNDYGIYINVRSPFSASPAVSSNTIHKNRFVKNGYAGIRIVKTCENDGNGVAFCTPSPGNVIERNTFVGNGFKTPESLPDNDGVTARAASLADNGTDLVPYPAALAGFTLTGNVANHNADLGFDVLGVVDGGHNVAKANGNPLECDGLSCGKPHKRAPAVAAAPSPASLLRGAERTDSHG